MMADPNGIKWDDQPSADGIQWDNPASFNSVQAGGASSAPLSQFAPQPPSNPFADSQETENAGAEQVPAVLAGAGTALERVGARTGRGLLQAAAGFAGASNPYGLGQDLQDEAFKASDALKQWEQGLQSPTDTAGHVGDVGGSLIGGFATLGAGEAGAQGQDVINSGGSVQQAQETAALAGATSAAGLGIGQLGKALPARLLLQGAASGASGEAAREIGNQILPDSMHRDFSMADLAFNVGAGAAGGFIPAHVDESALSGLKDPEAQGSATADLILNEAKASVPREAGHETTPPETGVLDGELAAPKVDTATPAADFQAAPAEHIPTPQTEEPSALSEADLTPAEREAFARQTLKPEDVSVAHPNEGFVDNGSGESSASVEAQNRLADEKAAGQTRALIERDGTVRPLIGVDAVDAVARPGQVIVQRGIGRDEWTVLSHGDDVPRGTLEGTINRSRPILDHVAQEASSARPIREDQTVLPSQWEVAQRSGEAGRNDVQRPPETGSAESRGVSQEGTTEPVSIKNESVAASRERRALEDLTPAEKETWAQNVETAKQKLAETPQYGNELAKSLIKEPRALRGDEGAILLHDRTTLENDHRTVSEAAAKALDSGDDIRYQVEKSHLNDIERRLDQNDQASRIAGTHGGRGLNFRKAMLAEDYSFARIRTVAKAKKGAELTNEQTLKLKELTDTAEFHRQRADALEAENATLKSRMNPVSEVQKRSSRNDFKSLSEQLRKIAKKDQLVDPNCVTA